MNRLYAIVLGIAAVGCGSKSFGSLCDQIPAPAACMVACDPQPGAPNTCTPGYHCSPDGHCDAQCTQNGGECGADYTCTADGFCQGNGSGSNPGVDANCPAVHLQTTPTTPSVELILDRSGSMSGMDINPTRYDAMHTGLTGASGAITTTQANVYFGAFLFSGDQCPLTLAGFSVPRALNNASAIDTLIATHAPGGNTPTAEAINLITGDFAAHPPPAGSPPVILLATDGEPNSCNNSTLNPGPSIAATKAAYTAGIRTFIIGLGSPPLNPQFLQDIANAGTGVATGQAPGCASCSTFYSASNPASLAAGFNSIINGVLSCDLMLNGTVDQGSAMNGQVSLNGMMLVYGTDWTLDPNGMVIHLIGSACAKLKSTPGSTVDAAFPCGSVIF